MTSEEIWEKYGGRKVCINGIVGTIGSIGDDGVIFLSITKDNTNEMKVYYVKCKWLSCYYNEDRHKYPMSSTEYIDIYYYKYFYPNSHISEFDIELIEDNFITF